MDPLLQRVYYPWSLPTFLRIQSTQVLHDPKTSSFSILLDNGEIRCHEDADLGKAIISRQKFGVPAHRIEAYYSQWRSSCHQFGWPDPGPIPLTIDEWETYMRQCQEKPDPFHSKKRLTLSDINLNPPE